MTINPADHLGLMYAIVNAFARENRVDPQEWVGVGYQALSDAARGFDPERGHVFSSYAAPTIRRRLFDTYMHDKGYRNANGIERSDTGSRFIKRQNSEPVRTVRIGAMCREIGAAPSSGNPYLDISAAKIIDQLSAEDGQILRLWAQGVSDRSVAAITGRSRARVHQLRRRALDRARKMFRST